MVAALLFGLTGVCTMGTGAKASSRAQGHVCGPTEIRTRESGKKDSLTVWASTRTMLLGIFLKGLSVKISSMGTVYSPAVRVA